MSENEQASCATCIFPLWVAKQKMEHGEIVDAGYCRRNPPAPILKSIVEPSKIAGAPPNIVHTIEPHYPPTLALGWCGEHLTPDEFLDLRGAIDAEISTASGDRSDFEPPI